MLKKSYLGLLFFTITLLTLSLFINIKNTSAEVLESSNYKLDEIYIGGGDMIQSNSANYQANGAIGDLVVGNTVGNDYQIETGSQTTGNPALSFSIDSAATDFGSFSSTSPSMATAKFSIANYTSYGYVVQIIGKTPSNGNHEIAPMVSRGSSQIGKEQFGINLTANTQPLTIGALPDNGQFGYGQIASDYSTANEYKYVDGEVIALAPKSSGKTTYTISYLINVSNLTPGGQYVGKQTLVIIGTY